MSRANAALEVEKMPRIDIVHFNFVADVLQ